MQNPRWKVHPPQCWGLDCQFHAHKKMYVQDILQLHENPLFPGVLFYKSRPVYKVDVVGVVVKADENTKCCIYGVDDGTGVITCCCWKKNNFNQGAGNDEDYSQNFASLPQCLKRKTLEIVISNCLDFQLGDLIRIRGKLKLYLGMKEVTVSNAKRLENPIEEICWMQELPSLYNQFYDKPYQLPDRVAQDVADLEKEEKTGMKSENRLVQELRCAIRNYLAEKSVTEFSIGDLYNEESLQTAIEETVKNLKEERGQRNRIRNLVKQAVHILEEDGLVCQRCDETNMFESLLKQSKLEHLILDILKRKMSKPDSAGQGCHYMDIVRDLHATAQYVAVQKNAVLHCLSNLEEKSDVIRTMEKHYIVC